MTESLQCLDSLSLASSNVFTVRPNSIKYVYVNDYVQERFIPNTQQCINMMVRVC